VTPGTVGVGGACGGCGTRGGGGTRGGCGTDGVVTGGVVTGGVVTGGTVTVGIVIEGTVIGGGGIGGRPAAADAVHPARNAGIIRANWAGRRRSRDLTANTRLEGPPEVRPFGTRLLLPMERLRKG
jgi:hypothetical protein